MDKTQKNRSEHKLLTWVCQGHDGQTSETDLLTSALSIYFHFHLHAFPLYMSSLMKSQKRRDGFLHAESRTTLSD